MHFNGTSGDVSIGSTKLNCTSWQATEWCEPLTATNRACGGFRQLTPGKCGLDASVSALWDSEINSGDPPLIKSGDMVLVTLDFSDDSMANWQSWMLITSVQYVNEVEGLVEYSFDAVSVGAYEPPWVTPGCFGGAFSSGFSSGFDVCVPA